jgi:signal transduction histidine kinase
MTYEPCTFRLIELAERNVRLMVPNAEHKRIQIKNLVPYGMMVYADYQMVDLVLRNLLSNALKFTESDGTIEVSARVHEDTIECSVSDSGVGMSQRTLEKLFRIDAKTSTPGTAGEEGTGLGLILCKELVEKNGGTIRVESEVGNGSTFTLTLPIKPPTE